MAANKFSIVISGWPAVGKTTIAAKLAEEFGLVMYNGGDILKMLAAEKGYFTGRDDWWDTAEAKKFMQERKSDPSFDKKVDKKLAEIVRKGGAVITSYTLPWLVQGEESLIKIWLRGSSENRAKRMANRDDISFAEAKKIIALRDKENKKIYHRLYGFRFGEDLTVFDYVLNTDKLPLDSLIEISKLIVRRQIGG
ncbi:cytidylate kinase-like family protein [Candidatus Nitrososphaera gargensis]|uniref:cytidylate kinase-like family protein n=1 Tax=Candidatus Nitrososphaera gargensis TaxID=497727 RepID=UPI0011E557F0|nr:cytidylate kinase family protein [Candidatus Nitrososphaera gargensis]